MLNDVFAAAWAVCGDEETAAEVTRRVLVVGGGRPALGALLAAGRVTQYAGMEPDDRDAIVLARALGWKTDRIARQLDTTAGGRQGADRPRAANAAASARLRRRSFSRT